MDCVPLQGIAYGYYHSSTVMLKSPQQTKMQPKTMVEKYTINYTQQAATGKFDKIIGLKFSTDIILPTNKLD